MGVVVSIAGGQASHYETSFLIKPQKAIACQEIQRFFLAISV